MATSGNSDGPEILLEVRPKSVSGDLAPRGATLEDFRMRAAEIAESVAQVTTQFRSRLEGLLAPEGEGRWEVDAIEIGFDLAVQAEAGVVIAKASTSATLSAKLTLKSRQDKK